MTDRSHKDASRPHSKSNSHSIKVWTGLTFGDVFYGLSERAKNMAALCCHPSLSRLSCYPIHQTAPKTEEGTTFAAASRLSPKLDPTAGPIRSAIVHYCLLEHQLGRKVARVALFHLVLNFKSEPIFEPTKIDQRCIPDSSAQGDLMIGSCSDRFQRLI